MPSIDCSSIRVRIGVGVALALLVACLIWVEISRSIAANNRFGIIHEKSCCTCDKKPIGVPQYICSVNANITLRNTNPKGVWTPPLFSTDGQGILTKPNDTQSIYLTYTHNTKECDATFNFTIDFAEKPKLPTAEETNTICHVPGKAIEVSEKVFMRTGPKDGWNIFEKDTNLLDGVTEDTLNDGYFFEVASAEKNESIAACEEVYLAYTKPLMVYEEEVHTTALRACEGETITIAAVPSGGIWEVEECDSCQINETVDTISIRGWQFNASVSTMFLPATVNYTNYLVKYTLQNNGECTDRQVNKSIEVSLSNCKSHGGDSPSEVKKAHSIPFVSMIFFIVLLVALASLSWFKIDYLTSVRPESEEDKAVP